MKSRRGFLILVMVVTTLAFVTSIQFDFISHDDPLYITANSRVNTGLSASNIQWAFLSAGDTNLWHPLTFMSHQLDVSLFGLDAKWHHAVNVFWHVISAALLFLIAAQIARSNLLGFFCALIWAVHPEKIQSVAWLSERKDVLSGAFFFASLYCFMKWKQKSNVFLYVISLLCFMAAAMAKPSVVMLPAVLFVLFYAEKNLVSSAFKSLPPLCPFIVVSLIASAMALYFQSMGGLSDVGAQSGLIEKLTKIPVSYAFYLKRFVWPHPSQLWFYPPESIWQCAIALIIVVVFVRLMMWLGKKERLIAVGLILYTVLWLPVSGIITVGFYHVADRYSYLPMLGLVLMFVGLVRFLTRTAKNGLPVAICLSLVSVALISLQQWQLPLWKNDASLFAHEMKVNPRSLLAPIYYGGLFEKNEPEKALQYYKKAHKADPQAGLALVKMGIVQKKLGDNRAALQSFTRGTKVSTPIAENWTRILMLHAELGMDGEADVTIRQGLEKFPNQLGYIINCGNYYLVHRKQPERGLPMYLKALELDPNNSQSIKGAAICYRQLNQPSKAQELLGRLPASR